jgi:hypothetical protein
VDTRAGHPSEQPASVPRSRRSTLLPSALIRATGHAAGERSETLRDCGREPNRLRRSAGPAGRPAAFYREDILSSSVGRSRSVVCGSGRSSPAGSRRSTRSSSRPPNCEPPGAAHAVVVTDHVSGRRRVFTMFDRGCVELPVDSETDTSAGDLLVHKVPYATSSMPAAGWTEAPVPGHCFSCSPSVLPSSTSCPARPESDGRSRREDAFRSSASPGEIAHRVIPANRVDDACDANQVREISKRLQLQ